MVAGFLRKVLAKPARAQAQTVDRASAGRILSLPALPPALYAVGDVHGCLDLYRRLEDAILTDAQRLGVGGPVLIVVLGDVVDRGPDSAGTIDLLLRPAPPGVTRLVLRGNHEDMMHNFLTDPARARNWLNFGGAQTLMSYGLHPDPEQGFPTAPAHLRGMLDHAVPPAHRRFLAELPLALQIGQHVFCHAGLDPDRSLSEQLREDLLWGDPARLDRDGATAPFVVHGHVITPQVLITPRRINVDTGAYLSGVLSAVRLCPDQPPFVLSVMAQTR